MPGRRPGRPRKNRAPRGRAAAKLQYAVQSASRSPPPDDSAAPQELQPVKDPPEMPGIRILNQEEARFAAVASREYGTPLTAVVRRGGQAPIFLDTLDRPKPSWRLVGHVDTLDLPDWFDAQYNDYNAWKAHLGSDAITISWIGHPGDTPVDLRARPLVVRWNSSGVLHEKGRQIAIQHNRVVARWEYKCRGICSIIVKEKDDGEADRSDDETSESESEMEEPQRCRWDACNWGVKLVIEITAEDLTRATIWQYGDHPNATPAQGLHWSRRLRNLVSERLRLGGAKVSTVQKELVAEYNFPAHASKDAKNRAYIPPRLPEFRRPNIGNIRSMFPAVRRRERLHHDPFKAIHILYKRNPNKIYNYNAHDRKIPDSKSKFTCAITDKHATERLILHGTHDGLGCDTSWRHKNENRAAVTFLTAVDGHGHVTPGAALLSANIKTQTLVEFLEATRVRVVKRAQAIVKGKYNAGPEDIAHTSDQDRVELQEVASLIVKEGWSVRKWMIDKCRAELNAIKRVFPGALVRVCQFHIAQAVLRWDCDRGKKAQAPRISLGIKYEILYLFREAQRCRSQDEWPEYKARFLDGVRQIIMKPAVAAVREAVSGESDVEDDAEDEKVTRPQKRQRAVKERSEDEKLRQWEFVREYFCKEWFTEEWLEHVTDIGLPAGQTRDGTWNTNNWSERAFKTFDDVFLENRCNKRIDRLAAIIMNEWLPYYEYWGSSPQFQPVWLQEVNFRAHMLWDQGLVTHVEERRFEISGQLSSDADADLEYDQTAALVVDLKVPNCGCVHWRQTGKLCVHMRAAQLFEGNGPVSAWKDVETQTQRASMGVQAHTKTKKQCKMASDERLDAERDRILKRLQEDSKDLISDHEGGSDLGEWFGFTSQDGSLEPLGNVPPGTPVKAELVPDAKKFTSHIPNARGRPPFTSALQTWRSKPRKAKLAVPVFQRKRGPKCPQRLSCNSIFPAKVPKEARAHASASVLAPQLPDDTLRHLSHGELMPTLHAMVPNGHKHLLALVSPTAPDLLTEDLVIHSLNLTRWDNISYMLRIEEMEILVELFNALCRHAHLGAWCLLSPQPGFLSILSDPTRAQGCTPAKDLLEYHDSYGIHLLLFIHLEQAHWTVFAHRITSDTPRCTAFNSLDTDLNSLDVSGQFDIALFLRNRFLHKAAAPLTVEAVKPSPRPFQVCNTGVQTDGSSCGWWAAITAFLIITTHEEIDARDLSGLTVTRVKQMLGAMWCGFLGDEQGLCRYILDDIHKDLTPNIYLDLYQPHELVAPRPSHMMRAPDAHSHTQLPDYAEDLHFDITHTPDVQINIHKIMVTSRDILSVAAHDGQLTDNVINAYLHLFANDFIAATPPALSSGFFIMDTLVSTLLRDRPIHKNKPFKPPIQSRKKADRQVLWVPETDIFQLSRIAIPWHDNIRKHWLCVGIDIITHQIHIYDSISQEMGIRYHRICERVLRFLEHESNARGHGTLPKSWHTALDTYMSSQFLDAVPQQTNDYDCGIYTIAYVQEFVQHHDPARPTYSLTIGDIHKMRFYITVRLAQARPIPTQYAPGPLQQQPGSMIHAATPPNCIKLGVWGLWQLQPGGLYFPAQITSICVENHTVTLQALPGIVTGPGTPTPDHLTFQKTWEQCDAVLGDQHLGEKPLQPYMIAKIAWPWALDDSPLQCLEDETPPGQQFDPMCSLPPSKQDLWQHLQSQVPDTLHILMRKVDHLTLVMSEWDKVSKHISEYGAFLFGNNYLKYLDAIDAFLVNHLANRSVALALMQDPSNNVYPTAAKKSLVAAGPGVTILSIYAISFILKTPAEHILGLAAQNRLNRPVSPQESAWNAMLTRIHMTGAATGNFQVTHRIADGKLNILPVEIIPDMAPPQTPKTVPVIQQQPDVAALPPKALSDPFTTNLLLPCTKTPEDMAPASPAPPKDTPVTTQEQPAQQHTATQHAAQLQNDEKGWGDMRRLRERKK